MSDSAHPDALLVAAIRRGDSAAWTELIDQYEGRLLAFVESRLRRRDASEDVVQETFIGFLTSLPNYDSRRPLESWLFTIAAHKLTDYLRREGRRPAVPLSTADGSGDNWEPAGSARRASSLARSGERHALEEEALAAGVAEQLDKWRETGDWDKVKCMELLFVVGWGNKQTAEELGLSEQQVANFKHDFVARLRKHVVRQQLNEDVFPDLHV
ncbi:MAG: RNA polymerase sigma factor [Pirellulales bacterium]|nr:RNA polymerase sigma factor [Pirellulales bacterium]